MDPAGVEPEAVARYRAVGVAEIVDRPKQRDAAGPAVTDASQDLVDRRDRLRRG